MAQNPSSSSSSSSSAQPHSSSNSYVQIVDKKLRVIRKKKAKLEGIQAAVDAGKRINADQEASLKKKDAIFQVNDHLVEIIDLLSEHAKNEDYLQNQRRKEIVRETASVLLTLFYSDNGSETISRLRESIFNAHGEVAPATKVAEKLLGSSPEEVAPGVTFKDARLLLLTPKASSLPKEPLPAYEQSSSEKVEVVSSAKPLDIDFKGKGRKRNNRQKGKQPADASVEIPALKPSEDVDLGVSKHNAPVVEVSAAPEETPQPIDEQLLDAAKDGPQEASGEERFPQSIGNGESNEKKGNGDRPRRGRGRGGYRGRNGGRGRGEADGFKEERGASGKEGRGGYERGRGRGRGRNDNRNGQSREGQQRQQHAEAQASH